MERKSSSTPSLLDAELGTGGCGSGKIPQTQPGNFLKPLLQGAVMVRKNPKAILGVSGEACEQEVSFCLHIKLWCTHSWRAGTC